MDFSSFQSLLATVSIIAGVVIYWRRGGNQASAEVLATYKLQVDQLKERVTVCEGLHRENLGEIGKLKGVVEEKDRRISILESIAQNRNPETVQFMNYVTKVASESEKYMKGTMDMMLEIKNFMHAINEHMQTLHALKSAS